MRWRLLPHDLPPWQTVEHDWRSWRIEGRWEPILAVLRERQGRGSTPSAAILDRGREGGGAVTGGWPRRTSACP